MFYPGESPLWVKEMCIRDRLKDRMAEDFKRLWRQDPKTVIYVSHNRNELTKICDAIYLLKEKPVKVEKIT